MRACWPLSNCTPHAVAKVDALVTHDLLEQQLRHWHLLRLGAEYDMKEVEQEAKRYRDDEAMLKSCAVRLVALRKHHTACVQKWTNVTLLQKHLEDAHMYEAFSDALKATHVTLEQALERLDPEQVDELMDCVRDQGQRLEEVQQILAEPLVSVNVVVVEEEEQAEAEADGSQVNDSIRQPLLG